MPPADLGICPEFWTIRPRFKIEVLEQVTSTSTYLWQRLEQGAAAGSVAIAYRQSAGRGQQGRIWHSPPGGLYLSLALEPDWPATQAAQMTAMSAWGIATALRNLGLPIQVKWPNDLYFAGKKLGGILTETKLAQSPSNLHSASKHFPAPCLTDNAQWTTQGCVKDCVMKQIVIGVGINWQNPVPEMGITLVKILEAFPTSPAKNKIICLEILAALVLRGILQGYFFQQRLGSQVFMKAYQKILTKVEGIG